MTENKPIIIDGVDVSKCCNAEQTATTPKCTINDWIHCDGQNCYFKQLARKTQECEELKEQYKWFDHYKEQALFNKELCNKKSYEIDKLKTENKELKRQHQGDKGLITATGKQNYQLLQEYDKLKAENDELKTMLKDLSYENQKFCYQIEEQTKQLEPFKDEYFKGLDNVVIAELAKKSIRITAENSKLEQTLAEIKEIAETISLPMGTGKSSNRVILAKQILQKISEVQDAN